MKKMFNIWFLLLVLMSANCQLTFGSNPQYFNDSIVIPSGNRDFSWCSSTNDYLFISDEVNDSIYVISVVTHSIVASKKTHANAGRIKYSSGKIILNNDAYSVEMYEASNIYNITYLQTLGGFNQGWLESDKDDNTYFYWVEHWAQKIRIIDFSSGTMVVKSNPSTGGNPQGLSRIGNFLYVSNAYQMSKKFDITNPSNPTSTNFGVQGVHVNCSNNYVLIHNYFGGDVVSIWSEAGIMLSSKPNSGLGSTTRDNLCTIHDLTVDSIQLYDISNGNFNNCIATSPRSITDYIDNYWIALETTKVILYSRVQSPPIQATNVNFSTVQTNQFAINWTDGNGSNRAVFMKQDSVGTASPINTTTYTANTVFGSGMQIGTSGWFCVFNGATHSSGITISNLLPNTKYRIMVCEYNGEAGTEQYNISSSITNPDNRKTSGGTIPNLQLGLTIRSGGAVTVNGNTIVTQTFTIGQVYGGGIIFYIDGTGQHGLIAATSDQGMTQWGCNGTLIGGTSATIGSGRVNTETIVNGCSMAGIAARLCYDLVLNGYNDWFLPSKDELHQMYLQKSTIGGFAINRYLSSTEYGPYVVWGHDFDNSGYQIFIDTGKENIAFSVRAIRAF